MSFKSFPLHTLFPFLFGGTFIEGHWFSLLGGWQVLFPFLFGGTFIEGDGFVQVPLGDCLFPFLFGGTFIEGNEGGAHHQKERGISLPFRRDFH